MKKPRSSLYGSVSLGLCLLRVTPRVWQCRTWLASGLWRERCRPDRSNRARLYRQRRQNHGMIPDHLMRAERSKRDLSQLAFPETIQACKKVMVRTSETIVGLPRVAGSPDAFFEGLTSAKTGLHEKKIFRLRTYGCRKHLMCHMNHVVDQGFAGRR